MSQLFQGVVRDNKQIAFNEAEIQEIGSNPIVTTSNIPITVPSKDFTLSRFTFNATESADTSRVPLIIALHYPLGICQSWLPYTQIEGSDLVFSNISDTLVNEVVFLICLWQTNMGSSQIPVWTFGRFKKFN